MIRDFIQLLPKTGIGKSESNCDDASVSSAKLDFNVFLALLLSTGAWQESLSRESVTLLDMGL